MKYAISPLLSSGRYGFAHASTTAQACLPRHPAVAYLFLVRSMKSRAFPLAPVLFLSACEADRYRWNLTPLLR